MVSRSLVRFFLLTAIVSNPILNYRFPNLPPLPHRSLVPIFNHSFIDNRSSSIRLSRAFSSISHRRPPQSRESYCFRRQVCRDQRDLLHQLQSHRQRFLWCRVPSQACRNTKGWRRYCNQEGFAGQAVQGQISCYPSFSLHRSSAQHQHSTNEGHPIFRIASCKS